MSIRRRLSASSVAVIAAAITVAAQSPGDRSQPTGTPSSSRPNEPTAPPPPTSATQPPAQPAPPSSATQTSTAVVPRSVVPDAGKPPAARAAPACGTTDQQRANSPSSSLPGVSADQFQRPGVPADAFVRPGVSAAQAGALLPGAPNASCTPPRDVVLYPDTTPPRRLPAPQN
jgi:hypothetical protein